MKIKIIKVDNITNDIDSQRIIALYKSSFVVSERIPLSIIKWKMKRKKYIMHKYFIDNTFIGFSLIYNHQTYTLIHYIVVNKSLRGKGYGSDIITAIKNEYKNNTIILNSEYYDKEDKDDIKRRRINFYQNNGFIINDFSVNEYGVDYFVLSNKKIKAEDYNTLIHHCYNKLLIKLFIKIN